MNTMKHLGLLVGMIFIAFLFAAIVTYGEDPLLDSMVSTGPNITLDEWRKSFRDWAMLGIGVALVAALMWYALGQWGFRLNRWVNAGKRGVWALMFVLPLGAFVAAYLLTPPVQEGDILATVFYLVNNVAVYYLATVWFSPSSFKYTPVGATVLRYW
jgi:hypothetical protein